jgi:hypothetical protein
MKDLVYLALCGDHLQLGDQGTFQSLTHHQLKQPMKSSRCLLLRNVGPLYQMFKQLVAG